VKDFVNVIPSTVKYIAVLDRSKDPNGIGEPLYMDVVNAFNEENEYEGPHIVGGRFGLSSKEFTPAMVKAIFEELKKDRPMNHFTVGIDDDVTHKSLDYDKTFSLEKQHLFVDYFSDWVLTEQ
jgi:pyruvate-ferredoxin/flavodoxin oxidoreductase